MSVKKALILLFVVVLSLAIDDKPKALVIKARFDSFTTDNIGNIYTVKGDELVKYLPSGKFFARYSNLKLGEITMVDATNPLKLLLYYRDFQQIVFLDNQLSVNSDQVSLEKLGYEQTELVCASVNNSFWIYNKQNNELLRFNENSKKIAFTGNLKQMLQADIKPNFMIEYNNNLFLNSPANGIYVFDIFGAFSKMIALKGINQFQVSENIIYYIKDSLLCSYNHKLFGEACKVLPYNAGAKDAKYANNKIYTSFKDSLVVDGF